MGFNEELFTLALKPISSNTIASSSTMAESTATSKESEVASDLPSTNTDGENMSKMTSKTKKIILASVVGVALGVIIFIVIKNRK